MTAKAKENGTAALWVQYLGFDDYFDAQIKELVGLKLVGSGFSALTEKRELEFEGSEAKIEEAAVLLASVKESNHNLPLFVVITEE